MRVTQVSAPPGKSGKVGRVPKRCRGCGRFLAEAQVAGFDLRRRWFYCERCALQADRRRQAS